MATKTEARKVITLIAPDDEAFDSATGRKGRKDVVSPMMNDLLAQAQEAGLSTFQIPDGAEFDSEDGKTNVLNVNKVRTWAKKNNDDDEATFKLSIGGGNGKNISVTIKPLDSEDDSTES